MARYIDADKAMEEINRIGGHNLCEWETLGVKALIDRQPTADVAPKSEVDKLEYTLLGVMHSVDKWLDGEELEQDEVNRAATMREKTLRIIENAKIEVAREFIKACDSMLSLVCEMTGLEMTFFGNYAKLKKKYTEGTANDLQ